MGSDFFWGHKTCFVLVLSSLKFSRLPHRSTKYQAQSTKPSLIFRHHFFVSAKQLAHLTFLGHRKHFQSIRPALLNLLTLDIGESRQMFFGPAILDELERI